MRFAPLFLLTIALVHADTVADLRADYDTPSSPFVNGQSAAGLIPDTLGTGSWTFFGRGAFAPGGAQTALVYLTASNSVRNANAFGLPGGSFDLPGLSNAQLICCGTEGFPAANELALHPGDEFQANRNLVIRWTAGSGISGPILVQGSLTDIGSVITGVGFQIFNQAGTSLFNYAVTSGNTAMSFSFSTNVAPGDYLDFVVGSAGNFYGDQSAISVNISGNTLSAVPEPGTMALMGIAGGLLGLSRIRRRA